MRAIAVFLACLSLGLTAFSQARAQSAISASEPNPSVLPVSDAASTAVPNWRLLKVGAGGYVDGLDIAPDGTMVVRTDTNGAYIWTGAYWRQLVTATSMPAAFVAANPVSSGQGVYEIRIAPSNPYIMYMAFDGYVFRSVNKGWTWAETNFAKVTESANDAFRVSGQKMAVDPNHPEIVYVGTPENGLFVTKDSGKTWAAVDLVPVSGKSDGIFPGITGIVFSPGIGAATQTIFASSFGNGVYQSTNGGSTWTRLTGGPRDVESAIVTKAGVYYSAGDSGVNLWRYTGGAWTKMTPPNQEGVAGVAIDPDDLSEIVVEGPGGQLNLSWNDGATWTGMDWTMTLTSEDIPWLADANVMPGNSVYISVGAIRFSATTANELIVTAGTGVWSVKIPTAGPLGAVNFTDMSAGIENLVANQIIAPLGGDPVIASWDRPFFRIANPNVYPSTYGPVISDTIVAGWSVDYASSYPRFLVGLADWYSHEESGYSIDGGKTWTPFAADIPGAGVSYIGGTIAASTPRNVVWAPAGGNPPYYTRDGGKTWELIKLPGVDSWTGIDSAYYLKTRTVTADRVQPNTFYFYADGVYKSTNSGVSWTKVHGSLASFALNSSIQSVPDEKGNVFFSGGIQGNGTNPPSWAGFYMSSDFGSTWKTIPNVLEVIAFGFGETAMGKSYPTIYIVGYVKNVYGVWKSIDQAETWTKIGTQPIRELDQITTIAGDPNNGKVYVGFAGGGYAYLPAASAP